MCPMETELAPGKTATVRVQFVLAAVMWTAASMMLGIRSVGWLAHLHFGAVLAGAAVILGWVKQHYVMRRVAGDAIERIVNAVPRRAYWASSR